MEILVFILGAIIGSFLNVVILRYNSGKSMAKGRSVCFTCAKTLPWYDLIPVISFFVLKGKCRQCQTKISWQYPLVEIVTGLLFVGVVSQFSTLGLPFVILTLLIVSLLVAITVYDLRHMIIPDPFVYTFIVIAFIIALSQSSLFSHLIAGLGLFLFFWFLWFISKGRWMGFGDAKLGLGIGLWLGVWGGLNAIILAFWLGALVGLILLLVKRLVNRSSKTSGRLVQTLKALTIKSEIPFAPFLVVGALLVLFFSINVIPIF